jgi:hypothetical protein
VKNYLHTFFRDFPTLAIVGMPRVLTFRSFEYQAIALARLFSKREAVKLPGLEEQERWEREREQQIERDGGKYHDIQWESGKTLDWLGSLYKIAGLGLLTGEGRVPPVLKDEVRWAIEHVRKYPEPGKETEVPGELGEKHNEDAWVMVERGPKKDLLAFI